MISYLESLDLEDLQPPTNSVHAVGKFQPKAKDRHKNENPIPPVNPDTNATQVTFPTFLPYDSSTNRSHSTATTVPYSKLHENQDTGNCEVFHLDALVSVDLGDSTEDSGRSLLKESAEPPDDPLSQDIVFRGLVTGERSAEPQVDPLSEATVALNRDLMTGGRSSREVADVFTNLESIHDVLFQSTSPISVELVSPLVNVASSGTLDEGLNHPAIHPSSVSYLIPMAASSQYSEVAFFNTKVDSQMDHDVATHSCLDSLNDIEFCEPTLPPAKGSGKFRPKLKAGTAFGKSRSPAALPDIMKPIPQQESQLHSTEIESLEEDSTRFPYDPFASSMRHCDYLQEEALPSLPVSESCSTKPKPSKRKLLSATKETADNAVSQEPREVAATLEGNEGDRSSRKLRKRIARHGPVNEVEDWTDETSNVSTPDENCLNDEYRGEEETSKQKAPRKLRNLSDKNEMKAQGGKKVSVGAYSVDKEPPKKKFSRSTCRNRRLVNKELLETPEEEIDPRKLIMKDLILLAEIKERKMTKEAAALKKPLTNPSSTSDSYAGNTNKPFDENDPFDSSQVHNSEIDDEATPRVEPSHQKLNYHSFMLKTPKERWSPSDTKLFYEAIRQFGTDFAMIQQLFPGRSRHQIKLKYKAEERKHSLQVADAFMHRSKDHSHFELVIERLQAQAEQTSNTDLEVPSPTGENEEEAATFQRDDEGEEVTKPGRDEDIIKSMRNDDELLKNRKQSVPSPDKLQEVQEVYDWSNYRSDDTTEKDIEDGYDWGNYKSDNAEKETEDTYDWSNYRS